MSERVRTTDAERAKKRRRGTRSDLTRILEKLKTLPAIQEGLREHRRLLEILTAAQATHGAERDQRP